MKTTGKLWNEYIASWPDDWWLDESDESVDGKLLYEMPEGYVLKDDDIVTFTGGCILKGADDAVGTAMLPHFRKWLKPKKVTMIYCTVPNDFLDTFTEFAKANNIGLSK